jgi:hypothetical protein
VQYHLVDSIPPEPVLENPFCGWYYRPGYTITMDSSETTGDGIVSVVYEYSLDGENWTVIVDADPVTDGVQWDTSNIPAYPCADLPLPVEVRVIMVDDNCNEGTSEPCTIYFCEEYNPYPCDQTLTINPGWSFVSIAVDLDPLGGAYTASVLASEINGQAGGDIVKYVVMWDGDSFVEYVVDAGVGSDFAIEKGVGYYLYSVSPFPVEFVIVGDCPCGETFDLEVCWTLIGWDSMNSEAVGAFAQRIDEFYGMPITLAVTTYDEVSGTYLAWYPSDGYGSTLFTLEPGKAYWVFVQQAVTGVPYP